MRDEFTRMSIQYVPYNVSVTKHVGGRGAIKHREFVTATGEMSDPDLLEFLSVGLDLALRYLTTGAILMAFMDWRSIDN